MGQSALMVSLQTLKHILLVTVVDVSSSNTNKWATHLMVYRIVPFCIKRKSLLGVVMLWAIDFFPFLKKVSGVQILLTIKLFKLKISAGPLNFSLSSVQVWRKKTSIVYSWENKTNIHTEWKMSCEIIYSLFIPNSKFNQESKVHSNNFLMKMNNLVINNDF